MTAKSRRRGIRTRELPKANIIAIDKLMDLDIPAIDKQTIITLRLFADGHGRVQVTKEVLARAWGCVASTVYCRLKKAEKLGLIIKRKTAKKGLFETAEYLLKV